MAQTTIAGKFLDPTVISALTEVSADSANDFLLAWDATNSTLTKVKPDNLGMGAATIKTTYSSHGLAVGDVVKSSGTADQFNAALATTAAGAEVVGIVTAVDSNTVTITISGEIDYAGNTGFSYLSGAGVGTIVFLSHSSAGDLSATEPSAVGHISKPLAVVTEAYSANSAGKIVLIIQRGELISTGTDTKAPNDATYLTTSTNSDLSNAVVVGSVGSSITVADADGFVVNDGGTVKVIPATDIKTYAQAIKIDDLTAGDDNTDLDSSTSRHGLLRKLDNSTTNFLRGDGAWAAAGSTAINARVYHNAAQSISTASWTPLAFNSERFDTGGGATSGLHHNSTNNSRFTIATAGVYTVWAGIEWQGNASGSFRIMRITVNGSTEIAHQSQPGASAGQRMSLSTIWSFSANDYVEVFVFQNSGSTLTVAGDNNYSSEFAIAKLN